MTVFGNHYNPVEINETLRRAGAVMPWLFLKFRKFPKDYNVYPNGYFSPTAAMNAFVSFTVPFSMPVFFSIVGQMPEVIISPS